MDNSLILIEQFAYLAAIVFGVLLLVWASRAFFWVRNRLAKRFKYSKAEMTVVLVVPVMYVLWRVYAHWPME